MFIQPSVSFDWVGYLTNLLMENNLIVLWMLGEVKKSFSLTRIPKILKPFSSAAILHSSNMSWMLSFFPGTVAILRPRTIFAFFLCSLKHPSDFHATATKELEEVIGPKCWVRIWWKKNQTYELKHLSSDKSDFCSLCLTKHCSKFPPKVSRGT